MACHMVWRTIFILVGTGDSVDMGQRHGAEIIAGIGPEN